MLHYGQSASLHYRMSQENMDGERVRFGRVIPDGGTFRQYGDRRVAKSYNQLSRIVGDSDATIFRKPVRR